MKGAGRLLRTRVDHGEIGVSEGTSVGTPVGTSVGMGISVAVLTGGSVVGVSEGGMNICVAVGVLVGKNTMGWVGEASGAQGGT